MKIFLKLKHWQVFLIWTLTGIISAVTSLSQYWIVTFIIYEITFIGWIYSIGKVTNEMNKTCRIENYKEDLWFIFLLIFFLPFGYFSHGTKPTNGFLMFGAVVLEGISIVKLTNFSAKAISQLERNKCLGFRDYLSEFLLILLLPLGIWIIQPRMNKIINAYSANKL